eukprot:6316855-Amphidinium_carterae.1
MQDIVQRGEMTITKIQTTHNPADTGSAQSSVGSLHGLPTSKKMTIGMIGLHQPTDNESQPVVAARNVQPPRDLVARDNAVEL